MRPSHTPEAQRAWRAKRKAEGRPVAHGTHRARTSKRYSALQSQEIIAWDGEGITTTPASGMDPVEYERMIRTRTRDEYLAAQRQWSQLIHVRIVPDYVWDSDRRRYRLAGEYADVPKRFLDLSKKPTGQSNVLHGNADRIAQGLGLTVDELLEELAGYEAPRYAAIRASVERVHRDDRPIPPVHNYTLLANSLGTYIEADSLSTVECLRFITDVAAAHPRALHIMYGGSYDANMIVADLSYAELESLAAGKRVTIAFGDERSVERYRLFYRARKEFVIERLGTPAFRRDPKTHKRIANVIARVRLWDVIGFFQSSFVSACRSYGLDEQLEEIEAMKAQRSSFEAADRERIRAYCLQECSLLKELFGKVLAAAIEARLSLRRFDGAGACAVALLQRESVRDHVPALPPAAVDHALRCAYSGGRIEICQIGCGPLYDYDLNSAYPAQTTALPSGIGRWVEGDRSPYSLHHVRFSFPPHLPWYPLFVRVAMGVQFPAMGAGWYHRSELEAAKEFARYFGGAIVELAAWSWIPESELKPFAFVPGVYEERKALKVAGAGAEKVLKLALNSLYGKTCQQVGARDGKPPPYFSLHWAGAITAGTRAALVRLAIPYAESVVMFATDGVFTNEPIHIPLSNRLGEWSDGGSTDQGVVAQAGVYWQYAGEEWKAKYRGFDRVSAPTPERVLAAWSRGERWIALPTTRFVTMRSALQSHDLYPYWRTWRTVDRILKIDGRSVKRAGISPFAHPEEGWVNIGVAAPIPVPAPIPYDTWYAKGETQWETIDGVSVTTFADEAADALL